MSQRWFVMIAILSAILLMSTAYMVSAQTLSQPDTTLTYSGRLADPSGKPVADGAYDFTFTLYTSENERLEPVDISQTSRSAEAQP